MAGAVLSEARIDRVTHDMRPGAQCSTDYAATTAVDRNCRTACRQLFYHRHHAALFVTFPYRRRAGARGFAADIDDCRAAFKHGMRMFERGFGFVEKLATIGKTVGRDIQNAHHQWLVEPQHPRPATQRRVNPRQISPLCLRLGGKLGRQPGYCSSQFTGTTPLARNNFAITTVDQREPA